ncbi:hypothetical protein [Streptomyces fagopyri]|uniref:hypothetical protein n=1 Tax=Streptomyces fagopyri TaxID=2662397 RepID=UPI00370F9498
MATKRKVRPSETTGHALYVVILMLFAITETDTVIRTLMTVTAVGVAFNLGRRTTKRDDSL